jgi:hypothetical protein
MILMIELGNRRYHLGEIANNCCCELASILYMGSSHINGDNSGADDQTLAKTFKLPPRSQG